jgi:hypothetical protein
MASTPRRPVGGSRAGGSAPKKIAGRARPFEPVEGEPVEDVPLAEPVEAEPVEGEPIEDEPIEDEPIEDEPADVASTSVVRGRLSQRRTTRWLAAALAVLALVGGGELFYLFGPGPEVSDQRPVVVDELDVKLAVDDATKQVEAILTFTWEDFDSELADSLKRITGKFRDEFEATATDSRTKVLQQKAEYSVEVMGSAVMRADEDQVTTLVFLNQIVYRGEGESRVGPDVYPFRIEVTTVRKNDRWLVTQMNTR